MREATLIADAEIVRVKGHQVRDVMRRYGMRPVPLRGAWMLDRVHLERLLVALDREHYNVRLEDHRPAPAPVPVTVAANADADAILGLW